SWRASSRASTPATRAASWARAPATRASPARSRCWPRRPGPRWRSWARDHSGRQAGREATMTLYELIETPQLEDPVLVLALEGWIDAGLAAAGVARMLSERPDAVTIARFSADELLDYRARRPIAHLVDGVLRGLTWPSIERPPARVAAGVLGVLTCPSIGLRRAVDDAATERLVLAGAVPVRLWHRFTDEVVGLALDHGVRMCVGLGAYPYAAPHTRPPRVACTASTPRLAEGATLLRGTLDFPGGIQAAIEQACHDRGIPSIGLWAQIPHYLPAQMPFPAGSLALVEAVNQVAELSLPTGDLAARAEATRTRLDELIAQNPEHVAMLRQLEAAWDQAVADERTVGLSDLPTGDELAAELEDFLRRQQPEGH